MTATLKVRRKSSESYASRACAAASLNDSVRSHESA